MKKINSKKIFLKYENIPNQISNKNIIDLLENIIILEKFIISSEFEKNSTNKTVYIFVENQQNIRQNVNKLNLTINNNIYEVSMQKLLNKNKIIEDIANKNDIICNFMNSLNDKSYYDPNQYLLKLAREVEPYEIETLLIENFGDLYLKKGAAISNTLRKISEHYSNKRRKVKIKYPLEQFDNKLIPKEIKDWYKTPDHKKKTLFITGESGVGKTQYALALLQDKNPLTVTHIEKLKDFDQNIHESILYDDVDFSKMSREEVIRIIDNEFPRDIRYRYGFKTIPPGILKIITSNKEFFTKYQNLEEIKRRIVTSKIEKKLFNKNINIQLNIYNNIEKK